MDQAHDPHALDPSTIAHLADKGAGYAELATRDFRLCHNFLRILLSLETDEVEAQGARLAESQARQFLADPIRFFLRRADDATRAAIWRAVEVRQPAELRSPRTVPIMAELRDPIMSAVASGRAPTLAEVSAHARQAAGGAS